MTQFTKNYASDISLNQALELGIQTMKKITKQKFSTDMVEVAVISKKDGYHKISSEILKRIVEKQPSN